MKLELYGPKGLPLGGGTITGNLAVSGGVAIGTTVIANINLVVAGTPGHSAGSTYGIYGGTTADAGTSANLFQFYSNPRTPAGLAIAQVNHFRVGSTEKGAGSVIDVLEGFTVTTALTQGTVNYGFRGLLAASGTARWNLFLDGTAPNYLRGDIIKGTGDNGQAVNIKSLTELTTIAAAATTDTTIQMPANAIILSVAVRVTTVIPTATSFSVGDSGSAARFSTANVNVAANSTDPGTKAGAYYNAGALAVRLTMNGGTPAANTGRVRVTITYIDITVPTS